VGKGFRFDDRSYDALAAAGIRWQDALEVLRARPRVRHHIGAVLRIAAQTTAGRWLAVAAVEEDDDDEYLIVGARELDEAEVAAVRAMPRRRVMSRKDAERVLTNPDWTGAVVDREPAKVSVVHSVRFPTELSRRLEAEATRKGVTPSVLIRDLVAAALVAPEHDQTVTVRVADLHRAIDLALHHAA
jgi:hypothetical protein